MDSHHNLLFLFFFSIIFIFFFNLFFLHCVFWYWILQIYFDLIYNELSQSEKIYLNFDAQFKKKLILLFVRNLELRIKIKRRRSRRRMTILF